MDKLWITFFTLLRLAISTKWLFLANPYVYDKLYILLRIYIQEVGRAKPPPPLTHPRKSVLSHISDKQLFCGTVNIDTANKEIYSGGMAQKFVFSSVVWFRWTPEVRERWKRMLHAGRCWYIITP